ncbi:MAG: hypothetical protein ACK4QW_15595 [Alphaproteobacteria bacterium]
MAQLLPTALAAIDLLQRDRQLALAQKQRRADARSRIAQIEADRETEARHRAQALAAASGATRARLGASGGGTADGSGAALLTGLVSESEAEALDDFARRQRVIQHIRRGVAFDRAINLLERRRNAVRFAADSAPRIADWLDQRR